MLVSVVAGLLAATIFATGTLALARSSRAIGVSAVAIAMGAGLLLNALVLIVTRPAPPDGAIGSMLLAGALNVTALALIMRAFRMGKVGLIAAIVSTEGAVAALLAGVTGERLPVLAWLAVAVIAAAVVAASWERSPAAPAAERAPQTAIWLALGAALAAGSSLFVIGRLSQSVALAWAVLPPRLIGSLLLGAPLLVTGRLQWSRKAAGLAAVGGTCELLGFFAYGWAAQGSVAIAAVVTTLYAPLSAVGAFVLWRERLSSVQLVGVAVLLIGVTAMTIVAA